MSVTEAFNTWRLLHTGRGCFIKENIAQAGNDEIVVRITSLDIACEHNSIDEVVVLQLPKHVQQVNTGGAIAEVDTTGVQLRRGDRIWG